MGLGRDRSPSILGGACLLSSSANRLAIAKYNYSIDTLIVAA